MALLTTTSRTANTLQAFSPLMLLSAVLLALASYVCRDHLFTLGSSILATSQADIIDTGYAKYLGNRSYPNTVAYLGIPYAEPPLGDRRFRAPLPLNKARVAAETKGSVVDATKYPNFCIQGTTGGGDAGGAGSEDCLNVNIYAPVAAKQGSNLPVLVYIHGGGYTYGNPANWPFDHWVNQSPNVVIVSVYYRLSSFEFRNGDLNAGFLDQIQALKWVKENIDSFGETPTNSVELHLVANEGEKLFSQAIAQSVYRTPLPTPEQQEVNSLVQMETYLVRSLTLRNHAGCGQGSVTAQLACLRKASVSALAMAQDAGASAAFTASGYNTFHPVVDGKIITEFPTKSILAGKFAKATTNETLSGGNDIVAALQSFFPSLSDADSNALIEQYPISDFASSEDLQFQTVTGDSELRCARSLLGNAFGATGTSWTYRYNQRTPGAGAVYHAAENWMMFKGTSTGFNGTTTFDPMSPTDIAFAQELIAYWISFVRSGNPNTFKLGRSPVWTQFTSQSSRIVLQEGPAGSTTVSSSFLENESAGEAARCAFVAGQVDAQQN
ncbi:Alpha/Beta hydrolase protein [Flammula alnicola]|nr:Alpha/Beta hydrolase protein [Flammula alnicola]